MKRGKLKRRALRLRKIIDTTEDGSLKQRLIKDYVKTIWQMQNA